MGDISCFIDWRRTCCANEDPAHPHSNALVGVPRMAPPSGAGALLVSHCDAQLLLEIGFTGAVRIQRLLLSAPADGRAPAALRLFANAPSLGFDGAEDGSPTQEVKLDCLWGARGDAGAEGQDVTCEVALNAARFQNVTALTLFVAENIGGMDTSALRRLTVIGARIHRVVIVPDVL